MGMTKASRQSQAIGDLYRDWLRIPGETPGWTAEDDFHQNEGWQVLTAEPGGVDYLEVDAGGRPALWAVPHGADGSAVLFAVHGGGYVGGSRFTHRKLFAHLAKAIGARALLVEYRLVHQGGAFPAAVERRAHGVPLAPGSGRRPGTDGVRGRLGRGRAGHDRPVAGP